MVGVLEKTLAALKDAYAALNILRALDVPLCVEYPKSGVGSRSRYFGASIILDVRHARRILACMPQVSHARRVASALYGLALLLVQDLVTPPDRAQKHPLVVL
jgi:hypothetical protein